MPNPTTVRLDDDLLQAMQKLKDRDGMPISVQIQRALRDFLTKKGVLKLKGKAR